MCVYIQSWYTSHSAINATVNDIHLLQILQGYENDNLQNVELKMMLRNSQYLSLELATVAHFSQLLSVKEKEWLLLNLKSE